MTTLLDDLDYGNNNIIKINSSKQITKHFIFNLLRKIKARLLNGLGVNKGILSDLKICEKQSKSFYPQGGIFVQQNAQLRHLCIQRILLHF